MNVLYFHQHFSTPAGSVGIRSYEIALRLVLRGHQVTIVCGSYKGGITGIEKAFIKGKRIGKINGINIIELDLAYSNNDHFFKRSLTFIRFALRSLSLVFKKEYDVVFATTTPLTAGIPGIIARWFKSKTFVFEVRDLWPELPKSMGVIRNPLVLYILSIIEWVCYHSAHHCIGLSPGIVKGIEKRGVPKKNISLIPNGCDLSIFDQKQKKWRPEGIKKTDLMAVFAGTFGIANGLEAILDTASELKKRNRNDIHFLLIGEGSLKLELFKKAKEKKLNNIHFHDPINKKKLAALMASADLGLQILKNVPAFYYGTSPNKFFDYIASGTPVLNNYPGWIANIIKKYDCGFVVKPDNPRLFADTLEVAANNRRKLRKMGNNARYLALKKFDRVKLSDNLVDILERTVNDETNL